MLRVIDRHDLTRGGCNDSPALKTIVSVGAAQPCTAALQRRSTPHPGARAPSPVPSHFHLLPLTINQHTVTCQKQLCAAQSAGACRALPYETVSMRSPDLHRSKPARPKSKAVFTFLHQNSPSRQLGQILRLVLSPSRLPVIPALLMV